ncbi:MAG: tRNA pseudouridine(13) synthase TruD [Phycisphaeraceae bacterium]|nr:tRNA pseudouridine(13) synthase TruD [Phycisphaeraceae bacterium]
MTIRKQPSDFRVEELLSPETQAAIHDRAGGSDVHALYELEKTSLTTPAAVNELCRALKARPDHASYAGLKDKHAQTRQHITVKLRTPSDAPRAAEGKQWHAALRGFVDHPITAADITGNRFVITVRDLKRPDSEEMDRRAGLLSETPSRRGWGEGAGGGLLSPLGTSTPRHLDTCLLFTNYFGAQRFGSARHGAGWIAKSLISGDFETALKLAIGTPARKDTGKTRDFTRILASRWGDWKGMLKDLPRLPEARAIEVLARGRHVDGGGDFKEAFAALPYFLQSLFVEAYQSHLWNRCACELTGAAAGTPSPREGEGGGRSSATQSPMLRTGDEFGEMLFAPASLIQPPWRDLDLPLLAKNSELLDPWKETYERVLASEGIALADLRVKGLKRPFFGEASRRLFAEARNFALSVPEPDELSRSGLRKRTASFDLSRGSYATVVLRALGQ